LPAEELAGTLPRVEDPVPEGTDCSQDGRGPNSNAVDSGKGGGWGECGAGGAGDAEARRAGLGSGGDDARNCGGGEGGSGSGRALRYRRAYLSNVCVLPHARRTGLGRRMMTEALQVCARRKDANHSQSFKLQI
jgi:GNAT superfamily N-acetyltransferase